MKVIQELVAHFERQHQLSNDEIKALLDQGFLASDAPARIQDLCDTPGTTYYFRVTGASDGSVWGTDVYTGDSSLTVAAVHAGAVKPGETVVVRVTVMRPLHRYHGSVRNGVTSNDYGQYGTAYRVDRV
ncbi:MAG TPA: LCCL domain-containing protein [Vicinamibacterales bacterium]